MNVHGIKAIYRFEMARTFRTITQSTCRKRSAACGCAARTARRDSSRRSTPRSRR